MVWGTLSALSEFPSIRLPADPASSEVSPCGLVREIVYLGMYVQDVYAPVISHLESLGYVEGQNLFVFDYDWRRSIFDNAERLAAFVNEKVPNKGQHIDILAHSMGGLIARIYARKHDGSGRLSRLISAGTPLHGSVKVYATLEEGWGALNRFMGGLEAFRRTVLSFPSTFELMPTYRGCCMSESEGSSAFAPHDLRSWLALHWDGIDQEAVPDLAEVEARRRELKEIVEAGLPRGVEDILLIGVDQRTPERIGFDWKPGEAEINVKTTWAGDGTVVRDSAVMPRAIVHPTSFSDHERLLQDAQVQDFLGVALTRGADEALRAVPVRPRSKIRTLLGNLTELVGVAVIAEEPALGQDGRSKAYVHLRLGDREPVLPEAIRLTLSRPDGDEVAVALRPDPSASDPTNPFEQTFVGEFAAGGEPGRATLTASVLVDDSAPRIVTRTVPILPR